MPKVKQYFKPQPYIKVTATIEYKMKYLEMSTTDLAERALISAPTLYKRLKKPEDFKLCELSRIARVLEISDVDLILGNTS